MGTKCSEKTALQNKAEIPRIPWNPWVKVAGGKHLGKIVVWNTELTSDATCHLARFQVDSMESVGSPLWAPEPKDLTDFTKIP